jgi:hypothetical protein
MTDFQIYLLVSYTTLFVVSFVGHLLDKKRYR